MSRVPLDKTAATKRTDGALHLAPGRQIVVYERGTKTEATGYTSQDGSTKVTYPLTADKNGRFNAWYPPGSYDLYDPIDDETQPWEAVIGVDSALVALIRERAVDVKFFGAVGDGVTDDTAALAAAAAAAQSAGVPLFVSPGVYLTDPLDISWNGARVFGEEGLSIVRLRPQHASALPSKHGVIYAYGQSNARLSGIAIYGLCVDGNRDNISGTTGLDMEAINLAYVDDSRVCGNTVLNAIDSGIDLDACRGVQVTGNRIRNCGGYGIHVSIGSTDNLIENNDVRNCGIPNQRGGIDQWGDSSPVACRNIYVGNYCKGNFRNYNIKGHSAVFEGNHSVDPVVVTGDGSNLGRSDVLTGVARERLLNRFLSVDTNADGVPDAWTRIGGTNLGWSEADFAFQGEHVSGSPWIYQEVVVVPGQVVKARGEYRMVSGSGTIGAQVAFYDDTNSLIAARRFDATSSTWSEFSFTLLAPANTAKVRFSLTGSGGPGQVGQFRNLSLVA